MKAEGVGLVGSVLMVTGTVVTAGLGGTGSASGPCRSGAEGPALPGPELEAGVTRGDWTGSAGGEDVEVATGEGRPGNTASPGVAGPWRVGRAEGR